jgi:multiple sugar transport system ATP-binding protein
MSSIRLEQLTKDFGGLLAVNEMSLTMPDGEFIALLGPSGCGKTTTMNMISGLERPTSGEIYFDDRAISRVPVGDRNVGFVFQNYAIFTHMNVYENLAFGLRVRKPAPSKAEIDERVNRVAEIVGVTSMLDRGAGRLSVNDMQKVALGRSMIVEPAIFLLDEPFSNLDAAFRAYMRAELKRIQHDVGQTMVYVTHDQVEAMAMADHIAVMNLGVLQQFGSPLEIYDRPANTFVAGFVGSTRINFLPAAHVPLRSPRDGRDGLTLAIRPEYTRIVPGDSPDATIGAKVNLVEPLGAKDIVHLSWEGHDVRTLATPGARPHVGEHVGVAFDPARVLYFENESGEAVA